MKTKLKRCAYCGELTKPVPGYWTVVCDKDECNEEDREAEIARAEQARFDAEEDGYRRYGGPGPDYYR